ncbi:MAG: FGGY family carbohydrate kinase, partial [Candidatus Bathyarchaeia archaeon]
DREGKPLRPALIWCDSRSVKECAWIRENIGLEKIHKVCGNTIAPYFGGAKWLWFKNNESDLYGKTNKILQCNSYAIYQITGESAIDFSQAGLCVPAFDINKRRWSEEICSGLGIDLDLLPKILASSEVVGEVTLPASKILGLRRGTPIVAGGGDFACSALACGVFREGTASQMLGTAGNLMMPIRGAPFSPKLINSVHVSGGYISIGNVFAGGLVRWFRDFINSLTGKSITDYRILDDQAAKVEPGSGGLVFLPHLIGGIAPLWNPFTRGVIFGLTAAHTPQHIYRAILEGVAYGFFSIIEIAKETGADIRSIIAVDGGAKSRLWRQIFADVSNIKFIYYASGGDATMGDALLAGKGVGLFKSYDIVDEWLNDPEVTKPDPTRHVKYMGYYRIYQNIYKHLIEDFEELHNLVKDQRPPKEV